MLKIVPINKALFPEGTWTGIPCVVLAISPKGEEREVDDIVTELLQLDLKHVLVKGSITENPELVTIIGGLTNKGKIVTVVTEGSDSIESIRRFKNVRIFLRIVPPTSQENQINPKNLPLLMDKDEIKLIIENIEGYSKAKEFLNMKLITRPTVLFSLSDKTENPRDIIDAYLLDTQKFNFKNRISKGMQL